MMSKTHVAVGIAAAAALTQPDSIAACMAAVAGGALGGIMPDVDVESNGRDLDAVNGRVIAVLLLTTTLIADRLIGGGLACYLADNFGGTAMTGLFLFAVLTVLGVMSTHRSFMHSLLALLATTVCVNMFCKPLTECYAAAYASHLALDLLTKNRIKLLFPLNRGFCLRLCRANKTADKVFFLVGIVSSILIMSNIVIS